MKFYKDTKIVLSKPCRGCTESGWQGLVNHDTGERLHEKTIAPGERDVIKCTTKR